MLDSRLHALLSDAQMRTRTIGELFAWTGDDLFEFLFGTLELLLVEEPHSLFVQLHLSLNERVHQFDAAALGRMRR
jgi:hypothetical protein